MCFSVTSHKMKDEGVGFFFNLMLKFLMDLLIMINSGSRGPRRVSDVASCFAVSI